MSLFEVLLDRSLDSGDLPPGLKDGYGGDLSFPDGAADRPYVYTNFVTSLDGMTTFGTADASEGRLISGKSMDDQWLMGLLRGSADAVMVGAGTLRANPNHTWTTAALSAADVDSVRTWREEAGRPTDPVQCFVTASGQIDQNAVVFQTPGLRSIVLTTGRGATRLKGLQCDNVQVVIQENGPGVDLSASFHQLRHVFGIKRLLCEGGPHLYGHLLGLGLVDESFQTVSPRIVGLDRTVSQRYGLCEGTGWVPGFEPEFDLVSARAGLRDRHHLFLRYRRKAA